MLLKSGDVREVFFVGKVSTFKGNKLSKTPFPSAAARRQPAEKYATQGLAQVFCIIKVPENK